MDLASLSKIKLLKYPKNSGDRHNQHSCQSRFFRHDIVRANVRAVLDPHFNKGLSFTIEERQRLNVNGLFPCSVRSQDEQMHAVDANFEARGNSLSRYRYMTSLRHRHERLYYRYLSENIEKVLPVVYTPTVGVVCTMFGMIFRDPVGIYVTRYDRGYITAVLKNWPNRNVCAICVTDGERILGLGDLGANGMGIAVGKLDLYTALGRIDPRCVLPITVDVGTNNEELLGDPFYIGARERRLSGQEYDDFIDEFMNAVTTIWGHKTIIHFEDFATVNAFKFLKKYQNQYCCFNDDIQGTGATGLAGFLVVERVTKRPLTDHMILFVGAGSAAVGISSLVIKELMSRGLSEKEAVDRIACCDVEGLITKDRKDQPEDVFKLAKDVQPTKDLVEIINLIKPTILLGATGQPNAFSEPVLNAMAEHNERPAIFALSNPTNKSECTAEQAYKYTNGRVIFSSGSPFPPVVYNGKRYTIGQANNCFIFPGVALGVMCTRPPIIPDEVFLVAARALADCTTDENIAEGTIYPRIADSTEVAFEIGIEVAQWLFDQEMYTTHTVPSNVCEFVKSQQYSTEYNSALATIWKYPEQKHIPLEKGQKIVLPTDPPISEKK